MAKGERVAQAQVRVLQRFDSDCLAAIPLQTKTVCQRIKPTACEIVTSTTLRRGTIYRHHPGGGGGRQGGGDSWKYLNVPPKNEDLHELLFPGAEQRFAGSKSGADGLCEQAYAFTGLIDDSLQAGRRVRVVAVGTGLERTFGLLRAREAEQIQRQHVDTGFKLGSASPKHSGRHGGTTTLRADQSIDARLYACVLIAFEGGNPRRSTRSMAMHARSNWLDSTHVPIKASAPRSPAQSERVMVVGMPSVSAGLSNIAAALQPIAK